MTIDYLQRQRRFVDETQVQNFGAPATSGRPAPAHQASRTGLCSAHSGWRGSAGARFPIWTSLPGKSDALAAKSGAVHRRNAPPGNPSLASGQSGRRAYAALARIRPSVKCKRDWEGWTMCSPARPVGVAPNRPLATPELRQDLDEKRLTEIDDSQAASIVDALADRLRDRLASDTMEALPEETRRQVHQASAGRPGLLCRLGQGSLVRA